MRNRKAKCARKDGALKIVGGVEEQALPLLLADSSFLSKSHLFSNYRFKEVGRVSRIDYIPLGA